MSFKDYEYHSIKEINGHSYLFLLEEKKIHWTVTENPAAKAWGWKPFPNKFYRKLQKARRYDKVTFETMNKNMEDWIKEKTAEETEEKTPEQPAAPKNKPKPKPKPKPEPKPKPKPGPAETRITPSGVRLIMPDKDIGPFAFAKQFVAIEQTIARPLVYQDENINGKYIGELRVSNILRHWTGEAKEGQYPKDLALLMLFLFSKKNKPSLQPDILAVVDKMQRLLPVQWDKQQPALFQPKVESNLTINMTNDGNILALLLIGTLWLKENKKLAPGKELLQSAYELLCDKQENFFAQRLKGYRFPFVISSWNFKEGIPKLLPIKPQSLRYLRWKKGGKLECIACEEGEEVYYGSEWNYTAKKGDETTVNTNGLCVQTLDSYLKEIGVEVDRKAAWYKRFIGTWEQAERRLKAFQKKRNAGPDKTNDVKRLNFVDYYSELLVLKLDLAVKQAIGYSDTEPMAPDEDVQKAMKSYYDILAEKLKFNPITVGMKPGAAIKQFRKILQSTLPKALPALKFAANVFWKTVLLLVRSPIFMELAIRYFQEIASDICLKMLAKGDASVEMYRTEGDMLKRFFPKSGEWHTINDAEKKELSKERNDIWYKSVQSQGQLLLRAISTLVGEGGLKNTLDAYRDVFLSGDAIVRFLGAMEGLPLIGNLVKKIGPEKIKVIIFAHMSIQTKSILKSIVQANASVDRYTRLYTAFFYGKETFCKNNKIKIFDGLYNDPMRARFGAAFEMAMFNAPYYAYMIAYQAAKEGKVEDIDIDLLTSELINRELVSGNAQEQQNIDSAGLSADDSTVWRFAKSYAWTIALIGGLSGLALASGMTATAAADSIVLSNFTIMGLKGTVTKALSDLASNASDAWEYLKSGYEYAIKGQVDKLVEWVKEQGVVNVFYTIAKWGFEAYVLNKLGNILLGQAEGTSIFENTIRFGTFAVDTATGTQSYRNAILPLSQVLEEQPANNVTFRMRLKELIKDFFTKEGPAFSFLSKESFDKMRQTVGEKYLVHKNKGVFEERGVKDFDKGFYRHLKVQNITDFFDNYKPATRIALHDERVRKWMKEDEQRRNEYYAKRKEENKKRTKESKERSKAEDEKLNNVYSRGVHRTNALPLLL